MEEGAAGASGCISAPYSGVAGGHGKVAKAAAAAAAHANRTAGRVAKVEAKRLAKSEAVREAAPLPGAVADCPMVGAMQVTPATSAGAPSLLDMAASPGAVVNAVVEDKRRAELRKSEEAALQAQGERWR